ncbi:hypothetical protein [Caballeronia sp. INSB1]|uniref:hypothetical protein n=1 Tax=Caballeronia sp. INSB1 TaxID=2921751 RepID=UPI0020330C21|nr:hypothetical protein [Caballeronia sp. INSB1]
MPAIEIAAMKTGKRSVRKSMMISATSAANAESKRFKHSNQLGAGATFSLHLVNDVIIRGFRHLHHR